MKLRAFASFLVVGSLFSAVQFTKAAAAQVQCNKIKIAILQAQLASFDQVRTPIYRQTAEVELSLSRLLLSCYRSGRGGGAYNGNTPLEDIAESAVTAATAADNLYQLGDHSSACTAYRFASYLYHVGASDITAYRPAELNEPFRKSLVEAAPRFDRQQAHYCH